MSESDATLDKSKAIETVSENFDALMYGYNKKISQILNFFRESLLDR